MGPRSLIMRSSGDIRHPVTRSLSPGLTPSIPVLPRNHYIHRPASDIATVLSAAIRWLESWFCCLYLLLISGSGLRSDLWLLPCLQHTIQRLWRKDFGHLCILGLHNVEEDVCVRLAVRPAMSCVLRSASYRRRADAGHGRCSHMKCLTGLCRLPFRTTSSSRRYCFRLDTTAPFGRACPSSGSEQYVESPFRAAVWSHSETPRRGEHGVIIAFVSPFHVCF